jgi:formate dehydrogenase subunit delta
MSSEKLVYMANQIAAFFESQPEDEAVAGVANHINKFWDPRMRGQLLDLMASGITGLKPQVLEAAALIRKPKAQSTESYGALH